MTDHKLISLTAENFMRLGAVHIDFAGEHAVIGGKNKQGKTSCLMAIAALLGGAKHHPEDPIKHGAKKARLLLETTRLKVHLEFDKRGPRLKVSSTDGAKFEGGPQGMLNELWNPLSFDPSEFPRMSPKLQVETLRKLAGLDFTAIDKDRAETFAKRSGINTQGKQSKAQLDAATHHDNAPDAVVVHSDLLAELERLQGIAYGQADERLRLRECEGIVGECSDEISSGRELVSKAERELKAAKATVALATKDHKNAVAAEAKQAGICNGLIAPDIDGAKAKLRSAEEDNRQVTDNIAHAKLEADTQRLCEESTALTDKLADIDAAKSKMIAEAKYPVDGLAVEDEMVTLNTVPFAQASGAEQADCGVAIGAALNPGCQFMLVHHGEAFDEDELKLFLEAGTKRDIQLIVARVGTGPESTVIIEDGEVVS